MDKKDILWAPWRIGYVGGPRKKGCFLCSAFRTDEDSRNLVLYRGRHVFVMLNLYPYNNGHIMVVPNRHIKDLDDLTVEEENECMAVVKKTLGILRKTLKAENFNIGVNIGKAAGAGLDKHIHFHIVPRWMGDTNFMPVITGTKVISQSLKELYSLMRKEFGTSQGKVDKNS